MISHRLAASVAILFGTVGFQAHGGGESADLPYCVDGIYPHLAMFNDEGECGTGAVVPWAGSLWAVTYGPHCPLGSSDRLYEIRPDLTRVIRPESVGGTPANRLVHRETSQLLIGPYVIDAQGNVRVVPPAKMPGRLTGAARHLTDPSNRVYVATMESGLYELDMRTLAVNTLVREREASYCRYSDKLPTLPAGWAEAPLTHVPGYHSKGLASGFGRVFLTNNGEDSAEARRNPFVASGALADWSAPGQDWRLVRRCQFTEVTTRDGIWGNEHPDQDPVWSLGWDAKSVILAVTTNGADWAYYRLPKASHCYDGAHGWNTEWPRIRDVGFGDGTLLATMHGTFWRFPADFSPAKADGIRPLSTYLKVIGDFCRWGDRLVFGCDDQAKNEFLGQRTLKKGAPKRDRSQSNLWFVRPEDLASFGPPSGEGWVWLKEDVKAGDVSDPYLYAGYETMDFTFTDADGRAVPHELLRDGDWVRVKALADAKGVYAHFVYGPTRPVSPVKPVGKIDIYDDYSQRTYSFPNVNGDTTVICREVATERDLLYAGGVFYEVPADNAGGFAELRPVALADGPVRSVEARLGLVFVNGRPMALDSLWKNGTAAKAYWLWRDWTAETVAACHGAAPVGFDQMRQKRLWVTYRSFNKESERTGQFGAMGVTNRCIFAANTINAFGKPYCEYPPIWKGIGAYDWAAFDAQVEDVVKVSPNARLMCMIDLNTPYWATHRFWLDSFTDVTHAACDAEWVSETKKWMLDFIDYAESRWGDRIGAYILSGGGTSEWYEYDRGRTSANKDAAWVKWCRAKGLDYGASVPPRPSLAKAAFEDLVYDPATEPEKIEYWKFHNSLPAGAILTFAKAARAAIPKKKEMGAFFGYFFVSDTRQTSFGHLDYERVLASPDIDFFVAPGNYSDRAIGGCSGSQLVDGTALRHGKRFLHEIDYGPHDDEFWGKGCWKTLDDDLAGNTREAAFAMARNANYWWFDMWGGFYRNPVVRERIAALKKIQDELPDAPSVAQVLIVADPESVYYLNERNPAERAFGQAMRNALAKTGASYDTCSFGDLDAIDLSPYRLVILNSTLLITPAREKLLKEKVLTEGRTVVWTYAPGLIDGQSLDTKRVESFAGVPYGTPGVSVTEMPGGWCAVYAHDYALYTREKLAEIEILAGVHRYVDRCLPVFAKENFLAIHTAEGGEMDVRLPKPAARVTDLLTGETVATDAATFKAAFAAPDTRLFKLEYTELGDGGNK